MRWTPGGSSADIEDRRGGGGGGFGFGRGPTIGCGGAIILLILSLLTGKNFFTLVDGTGGSGGAVQERPAGTDSSVQETPQEKEAREFVTFVLNDAQDTWTKVMEGEGIPYRRAKLVLFRNGVQSACGNASSQSGPFYCPADEKVYIDLAFYDELRERFGAPGDFAQAYVIAHEIGHHVQHVLGIAPRVREAQQRNPRNANDLSVRLELQADCFAGVWGHSTSQRNILEGGDVEEGLNAAAAIGDDRMQKQSGGRVNPESFTHGSSEQRVEWFRRGLQSGRIADCDTFQ